MGLKRSVFIMCSALLAVIILGYPPASATITRSVTDFPSRVYRFEDDDASTTGRAVDFGGKAFTVKVTNSGSTALYVKFIDSKTVAAAELSAPVDETLYEGDVLAAGETEVYSDLTCYGMVYDRPSGSGAIAVKVMR